MKELKTEFIGRAEVKGFIFKQLQSSDKGYLYQVNAGESQYYEIFKKKINTQFDCISYPKSTSFGMWAYTTYKLDRAEEIFKSL